MENTISLSLNNIKVLQECDVLVLGAGMSGFAAALGAARAGVHVVLADKNHFPGGVGTSGLMCSISNYFVTRDNAQVTSGIAKEFLDRLVSEGAAMPDYMRASQPQIPNDPELTKRVMVKMLRESHVQTLYESMLVDVIMVDSKVTHCVFQGRDQTFAIKAKKYVDASGDLSIWRRANGEYEERDDGASFLYRMANVNIDKIIDWLEANPESYDKSSDIPTSLEETIENWRKYGVFHLPHGGGTKIKVVKNALGNGAYNDTFGKHYENLKCFGLFSARINKGAVVINSNWYFGDCYDIIQESEREEEGRLLIEAQSKLLIDYFPGFEHSYLLESAAEIGHRVSRKPKCKLYMDENDFYDGKYFNDTLGMCSEVDRREKPYGKLRKGGHVPLSMLVHDHVLDVIVGSGKNTSATKWGMIRGQVGCLVMGQGAGVVAAVAATTNVCMSKVNISTVQKILKKQNVML